MSKKKDYTLETLLEMDGYILEIGEGYWVKIEAKKVTYDHKKPAGIKYSLTLHNKQGKRILGYDNAHAASRSLSQNPHDHFHKEEKIHVYYYQDAATLLEDFWRDVEKAIERKF